jgi:hypothetical protein
MNYYCDRCHESVGKKIRLGPRKVLKKGFWEDVYDLYVEHSFFEHETYVKALYYKRDAYCSKCGKYLGEMDYFYAREFGEIAPRRVITRFFEYCRDNGKIHDGFFEHYNYPGEPV